MESVSCRYGRLVFSIEMKQKTLSFLGLFVYACRFQWTVLGACYSHETAVQCKEQNAGHKGPAGDHA